MKRRDFIKKSLLGLMAAPFAQAAMPSVAEAEQVSESPALSAEGGFPIKGDWEFLNTHEPISHEWEVASSSDRAASGDMIGFYGGEPTTPEHLTLSDLVTALKEGGVLKG